MNITDLIEELEEIIRLHGDMPVSICPENDEINFDVENHPLRGKSLLLTDEDIVY